MEQDAPWQEGPVIRASLCRCRTPNCATRGGAVLGRVTSDDGLVLDSDVQAFADYLDTRRAVVSCPVCGMRREFRGSWLTGRAELMRPGENAGTDASG